MYVIFRGKPPCSLDKSNVVMWTTKSSKVVEDMTLLKVIIYCVLTNSHQINTQLLLLY